jgi:sortase A
MKPTTKKIIISIGILLSILVFVGVFVHASVYAPDDEAIPSQALRAVEKKQATLPGHGAELSIPKLKIDARVQEVGITTKGNIGTPNNFSDVGWYKYGPLPGKKGTAVIDGHVDNGLALPGVFKHLVDIELGDDVYVKTKEGDTLHFVVKNIETYDYNAPTTAILSQTDVSKLILITCTGTWVDSIRTHNKRLVVTTELVE